MRASTILCPVDFSNASLAGLRLAIYYTLRVQGHLRVVHVVRPTPDGAWSGRPSPSPRTEQAHHRPVHGNEWVSTSVETGDVADEIARVADRMDADLIVIGSRPSTGWERVRDGYLPDEIASAARCPVVVLEVDETHQSDRNFPDGMSVNLN